MRRNFSPTPAPGKPLPGAVPGIWGLGLIALHVAGGPQEEGIPLVGWRKKNSLPLRGVVGCSQQKSNRIEVYQVFTPKDSPSETQRRKKQSTPLTPGVNHR